MFVRLFYRVVPAIAKRMTPRNAFYRHPSALTYTIACNSFPRVSGTGRIKPTARFFQLRQVGSIKINHPQYNRLHADPSFYWRLHHAVCIYGWRLALLPSPPKRTKRSKCARIASVSTREVSVAASSRAVSTTSYPTGSLSATRR